MDTSNTTSQNKRKKTDDDDKNDTNEPTQSNTTQSNRSQPVTQPMPGWPKYLMAKSQNENTPLTKLSPFTLAKGINEITKSRIANVTVLNNNYLLLEANTKEQSDLLVDAKQICNIPVSISPHSSLNFKIGVIKCKELDACTNDEIIAELHEQYVIKCRRITIQRNGETINTNTYVLTFNKLQLPEIVRIGYLQVRVEQYLPSPLRCTNCQKFGHHATKCRNPQYSCWRCSKHHEPEQCNSEDPTVCINCQGSHPSSSKKCPAFDQEKEIIRLKYTYNLTFTEARRRVRPKTQITYASVATKKTVSRGTQTETNPEIQSSDFEPIKSTNRSAKSDQHKPSTSKSLHTKQSFNQSSESKPTTAAEKKNSRSQPSSRKFQQTKNNSQHLLNRYHTLQSMDTISDISDLSETEDEPDPLHSSRPPDKPLIN